MAARFVRNGAKRGSVLYVPEGSSSRSYREMIDTNKSYLIVRTLKGKMEETEEGDMVPIWRMSNRSFITSDVNGPSLIDLSTIEKALIIDGLVEELTKFMWMLKATKNAIKEPNGKNIADLLLVSETGYNALVDDLYEESPNIGPIMIMRNATKEERKQIKGMIKKLREIKKKYKISVKSTAENLKPTFESTIWYGISAYAANMGIYLKEIDESLDIDTAYKIVTKFFTLNLEEEDGIGFIELLEKEHFESTLNAIKSIEEEIKKLANQTNLIWERVGYDEKISFEVDWSLFMNVMQYYDANDLLDMIFHTNEIIEEFEKDIGILGSREEIYTLGYRLLVFYALEERIKYNADQVVVFVPEYLIDEVTKRVESGEADELHTRLADMIRHTLNREDQIQFKID